MGEFISKEQQIVVENRKAQGYECSLTKSGFWLCTKGRHTMLINGLGYDCYVRGQ